MVNCFQLYAKAYQVNQSPLYRQIMEETIGWLDREMTDSSGGFYSSLDADSEGEEGKFYVWTDSEIDAILTPEEQNIFKTYYNVKPEGNWEDKNILHRKKTDPEIAKELRHRRK